MTKIGLVGLGRMGGAMIRRLHAAGHSVVGIDPSSSARRALAADGLATSETITALAGAEVVLSSLPDTPQVTEVYTAQLFDLIAPGALLLDLSTIDIDASRSTAERAGAAGHSFCDCPVIGTSIHAADGTLVVMVGGSVESYERALPYLEPLSRAVHHVGDNGMGLEMKLVTNRLLTSVLVSIAESILEMEEAGLDVEQGLALLGQGAVPRLLDYKAPSMARRDHTPLFTVDLMTKDLALARSRREPLPVGMASSLLMEAARAGGYGPSDISAVIEVLSAGKGLEVDSE